MHSSNKGNLELVEFIIDQGANVNLQTKVCDQCMPWI